MKRLTVLLILAFSVKLYAADNFVIDEPYAGLDNSLSSSQQQTQARQIPSIGSIPTPESYSRGEYLVECNFYDGGGFQTRFMVGIFDAFSFGISENIDGLIGTDGVRFNIPGAYVKFTLFPKTDGFNAAFGLDNFAYGRAGSYVSTNGVSSSLYGAYLSLGRPYTVFGAKNIFAFGLRFPLLPVETMALSNTSLYVGATLGTRVFSFAFTIENLYLSFTRSEDILPSFIFSLTPFEGLSVRVVGQYQFDTQTLNRILSLSYRAEF